MENTVADSKKKHLNKIKTWLKVLAISVGVAITGLGYNSVPKKEKKEDNKITVTQSNTQSKDSVKQVSCPIMEIKYVTDTLSENASALAYYTGNTITRNYVENNDVYKQQLNVLVHEKWHMHNDKMHYRKHYNYTAEEYYKLCMHDEISANLASLLTLRYEYIGAQDKDAVIRKYSKGRTKFYFDAIRQKKIDPLSKDPKKNAQEYTFMVNGMKDSWLNLLQSYYSTTHHKMLQRYINSKKHLRDNSGIDYQSVKKYMYTIGGINFDKYMKKDIEVNDYTVNISDKISKISYLRKCPTIITDINNNYDSLIKLQPNQQAEAYQHIFLASLLKEKVKNLSPADIKSYANVIDTYYKSVVASLGQDQKFKDLVANNYFFAYMDKYSNTNKDTDNYESFLHNLYTINGLDIRESIPSFEKNNVPIQNFYTNYTNSAFLFEDYSFLELLSEKSLEPRSFTVASPTNNQEKKRVSEPLIMKAPNFEEPILVSCTPEQQQEILQCIKDFENIPEVLKSCRTKDIQTYYKNNRQNSL